MCSESMTGFEIQDNKIKISIDYFFDHLMATDSPILDDFFDELKDYCIQQYEKDHPLKCGFYSCCDINEAADGDFLLTIEEI